MCIVNMRKKAQQIIVLFIYKSVWIWLDKELISCESKTELHIHERRARKKIYAIHV